MPDKQQPDRFAAERQEMAGILRTTVKNLPARMAGLGLGPACGRCGGSGSHSYNQADGSRCYGCRGNRVVAPGTTAQWRAALAQGREAAAAGKVDAYLAYLDARKVSKQAADTVMAAWKATGIEARYDWRKASARDAGGLPAHPADRRIADANGLMAAEHARISGMSADLQRQGLPREERQAMTVSLARAVEEAVARIGSVAALHLGPDGGNAQAAALTRLEGAQRLAMSITAYGVLLRRAPDGSEAGRGRNAMLAAMVAAREAAVTGVGMDGALRTLADVVAGSPASLLQQATRRDWRLYFRYEPPAHELAACCADLRQAIGQAAALLAVPASLPDARHDGTFVAGTGTADTDVRAEGREMAMTGRNDLVDRRREAADGEFERYDMGGETVEDSSGWEYTIPGTEMSRPVFFRNADDPDADSVTGHFRVVFAASDSAEVVEAYAAIRGSEFGTRVPPEPAAASGRAP